MTLAFLLEARNAQELVLLVPCLTEDENKSSLSLKNTGPPVLDGALLDNNEASSEEGGDFLRLEIRLAGATVTGRPEALEPPILELALPLPSALALLARFLITGFLSLKDDFLGLRWSSLLLVELCPECVEHFPLSEVAVEFDAEDDDEDNAKLGEIETGFCEPLVGPLDAFPPLGFGSRGRGLIGT